MTWKLVEKEAHPRDARKRIDEAPPLILAEFPSLKGTWRYRVPRELFMGCMALATRISELVTVVSRDGAYGFDVRVEEWEGEEWVIFTLNVLKRKGGITKDVALPLRCEPYAKPLLDYFKSRGDSAVFPFSRQYAWKAARNIFDGLTYKIEGYTVWDPEKLKALAKSHPERLVWDKRTGKQVAQIPADQKPASDHFLRHMRLTELGAPPHNFTGEELGKYVKWSPRTFGVSVQVERYVRSSWRDYAKKLIP